LTYSADFRQLQACPVRASESATIVAGLEGVDVARRVGPHGDRTAGTPEGVSGGVHKEFGRDEPQEPAALDREANRVDVQGKFDTCRVEPARLDGPAHLLEVSGRVVIAGASR